MVLEKDKTRPRLCLKELNSFFVKLGKNNLLSTSLDLENPFDSVSVLSLLTLTKIQVEICVPVVVF